LKVFEKPAWMSESWFTEPLAAVEGPVERDARQGTSSDVTLIVVAVLSPLNDECWGNNVYVSWGGVEDLSPDSFRRAEHEICKAIAKLRGGQYGWGTTSLEPGNGLPELSSQVLLLGNATGYRTQTAVENVVMTFLRPDMGMVFHNGGACETNKPLRRELLLRLAREVEGNLQRVKA
jgi:hypothetical protein